MIFDLKPYPAYRDSGVPWLGEVPAHWEVRRAKCFMREVDERSTTGEEELLSVSHKTGVTPRRQKSVTMFLAESNVGHKVCRPGDVVVNTMWAWMAALGVSKQSGIVSPSYGIYRLRRPDQFLQSFLDELLRTPVYRSEYVIRSTGITGSRLRLYPDAFLAIPMLRPEIAEQSGIIRFLDHTDRGIRRYIRAKQKLIALLAETREAVTHDALQLASTRSLPLEMVADRVDRPINRRDDQVYTPIGLFNRGRGIFHKESTKGAQLGDSTFFWIKEGDLVLSGQFAWEGAIALAGPEDSGCVATHRYPVFRGKRDLVESAYLLSFFKTGMGHLLLDQYSRGAAGRNRPLNARTLMKEKIPIPPLLAQQRITALVHLEKRLYRTVAKLAEFLREYRTRLIADVVTGKLDVREAATRLPEGAEEPGPLDDTEAPAEGDENGESADLDVAPEEAEA